MGIKFSLKEEAAIWGFCFSSDAKTFIDSNGERTIVIMKRNAKNLFFIECLLYFIIFPYLV
ncbi:hypothetical protein, partial [Pseudobutyrivibrio sp.]